MDTRKTEHYNCVQNIIPIYLFHGDIKRLYKSWHMDVNIPMTSFSLACIPPPPQGTYILTTLPLQFKLHQQNIQFLSFIIFYLYIYSYIYMYIFIYLLFLFYLTSVMLLTHWGDKVVHCKKAQTKNWELNFIWQIFWGLQAWDTASQC